MSEDTPMTDKAAFNPEIVERWQAETFFDKELVDVVRASDFDRMKNVVIAAVPMASVEPTDDGYAGIVGIDIGRVCYSEAQCWEQARHNPTVQTYERANNPSAIYDSNLPPKEINLPSAQPVSDDVWIRQMAAKEDGCMVNIGTPFAQLDHSEGIKRGAFAPPPDPPPLPVDEKFLIYLDDEGDYIVEAQRGEQHQHLASHGNTPDDAIWRMRQTLDMVKFTQPAQPDPDIDAHMDAGSFPLCEHDAFSENCSVCLSSGANRPSAIYDSNLPPKENNLPSAQSVSDDEWIRQMAAKEDGCMVNIGTPFAQPEPGIGWQRANRPSAKVTVLPPLKYLQPSQYASWLRKVDDPDWYDHRHRGAKDNAMASAIRELRDQIALTEAAVRERDALKARVEVLTLALGLNCELHGCSGASCSPECYMADAQKMIERVGVLEAERNALQARVDALKGAISEFLDSRATELDMMTCEYRRGTSESEAWHKGVFEMWRVLAEMQKPLKAALNSALKGDGQ